MTAPDNASQPTSIGAVSTGIDGPVRTTDVIDLLEAVERIDGVAAVSEQGLLALEHDRESVRHLWLAPEGQLAGYAQVDDTGSAELCVHPAQRNRGMGRQLVEALQRTTDPLTIWAHGNLPAAQALARATELRKTRELLQMAYELPPAAIRVPDAPVGAAVRPFRPGKDEEAWVALNAKAFVEHPEQGRMTVTDLEQRQATNWFDPSLLWLAHLPEEPQSLLASMWVKALPGEDDGEIYVTAVDPDNQGRGLGGWLTKTALREMQVRGLRTASLYVDGENTPAVRTYERAGFTRAAVDVQYSV